MHREYTSGAVGAFDAHAHLDHLDEDALTDALSLARTAGIGGWAIAASDPRHWDRLEEVCARIGAVAQLGLHPWWAQEMDEGEQDRWLAALERRLTPHGLGETGLDRVRATTAVERERQRRAFRLQIAMARDHDLPLVLHGVRAWGGVLDALPSGTRGVLHSFSGSPESARRAVAAGLHLSFGPSLLRSAKARAAVQVVPADRLLFETDAPDQGAIDSLIAVAHEAALLRGADRDELLATTSTTARRLFRAPE